MLLPSVGGSHFNVTELSVTDVTCNSEIGPGKIPVPSSKHCTIFPINGTQLVAVTRGESTITPEQSDRHAGGTPLREQHEPWFRPPAPQRKSLWNSPLQTPAKALMSLIEASYEQRGKQTSLRSASTQHAVTL